MRVMGPNRVPRLHDDQGLNVPQVLAAGSGITDMAQSHVALSQRLQPIGSEHIRYQAVALMMGEHPVVIDGDAAGFLSPVLKGIEGKVDRLRRLAGPVFKDPEYAAFLV